METKICSKCGIEKPITEYHKNGFDRQGNKIYSGYCIACANKFESARYQEKKAFINSQRQPCAKCGDSRIYVLDFHHIDETQKEFTIGRLKKGSKKILQEEINKCISLCANCHREFHYLNKNFNVTYESFISQLVQF